MYWCRKCTVNVSKMQRVVKKQYALDQKIGRGAFGKVYQATDLKTSEVVCVKVCKKVKPCSNGRREALFLKKLAGCPGFPKYHGFERDAKRSYLVMQLLGNSMGHYLSKLRKFSLATVCEIGVSLLDLVQEMHRRAILHRDLKPDNILQGRDHDFNIYIVDFGLAKLCTDKVSGCHIPFRVTQHMAGTARYTSTNSHLGMETSRRDDIQSLFFVLMHFYLGTLPWKGLKRVDSNKNDWLRKISFRKQNLDLRAIDPEVPTQFIKMYLYIMSLQFYEDPSYNYLKEPNSQQSFIKQLLKRQITFFRPSRYLRIRYNLISPQDDCWINSTDLYSRINSH